MNKNDTKNEALVKQIEQKEKTLVKPNIQLKTNCSLNIFGSTKNLNVCNKEALVLLKVQLNMMGISAKDMGISADEVIIGGFSLTDWMSDINAKIELCEYNDAKTALAKMKDKLNKLLSEDRRTEMALNDIESMLGTM